MLGAIYVQLLVAQINQGQAHAQLVMAMEKLDQHPDSFQLNDHVILVEAKDLQ